MQHIWPLLIFLSFNVKKIFKTNNNLPGLIESICKHFGLYHLKMIFTTRICLHCEVAETAILFPKRLCLNNNMSFLANPCIHWFHSFMKINCFLLLLEIESSDHICEQEEIAPMHCNELKTEMLNFRKSISPFLIFISKWNMSCHAWKNVTHCWLPVRH